MTIRRFATLALVGALGTLSACSSPGTTSGLPQADQGGAPQSSIRGSDATATPAPSPTPITTPSPTPGPTLPPVVVLGSGYVNGAADRFTPPRGDSSTGGTGAPVDGKITCNKYMVENQFHIHSYVGVLVNGQWYATPDSIGMVNPAPPVNGYVNKAQCFYYIHTHDASGVIHQEKGSKEPLSGSLYTLGNLIDVWGQPLGANNLGSFTGIVRTFVATTALRNQYTSGFTEFAGDPNTISLYSHEAIFIEVGPPYVEAANLPTIRFSTEY